MNEATYTRYVKFAKHLSENSHEIFMNSTHSNKILRDAGIHTLEPDNNMEEDVWIPKPAKWEDVRERYE